MNVCSLWDLPGRGQRTEEMSRAEWNGLRKETECRRGKPQSSSPEPCQGSLTALAQWENQGAPRAGGRHRFLLELVPGRGWGWLGRGGVPEGLR